MREINLKDPDVAYLKYANPMPSLVYWELGNFCSYRCSYCSPQFHIGDNPYQPFDTVMQVMNRLPPSLIIFSGGEPTFHPDIERIATERPTHISMSVVSNASRPFAFWERFAPTLDAAILSYHPEFVQFDRFFKVAELVHLDLKKNGRVNVLMLHSKWDECVAAYEKFAAAGIPVTAKEVLTSFGVGCVGSSSGYSEEQVAWLANASYPPASGSAKIKVYNREHQVINLTSASELFVKRQTNFKGWKCHVPEQYLVIKSTGEAFDTSCDQKRKVGDIYNGFTYPNEPITCKQNLCWCFSDIAGTKSPPTYDGPIPK